MIITQGYNAPLAIVAGDESSIYQQILLAVKTRIDALALDGAPTTLVRKIAVNRDIGLGAGTPLPAIIIAPDKDTIPPLAGVIGCDDVTYGVWVLLIDADNQEKTFVVNLDVFTAWRERIRKSFHQQRLPGVPSVHTCVIEPGAITIPAAWQSNLLASALLLRFTSREPRD